MRVVLIADARGVKPISKRPSVSGCQSKAKERDSDERSSLLRFCTGCRFDDSGLRGHSHRTGESHDLRPEPAGRDSQRPLGISHIYAKNEADLFFAQGYNVAHDRLFQLEVWRRQATGTVAEMLGRRELKRDVGNRSFAYRGDLKQELNWYHPRGAAIVEAFVAGINAYIAETQKNPTLLTPEFKMLGITPGKWTPAVVVSRFNGLLGNIDQEMNFALAVRTITQLGRVPRGVRV